MPSEKSYARAHEIAAAHVPAEKANLAKLIRLRTDIALALDEAKAERTEECALIAEDQEAIDTAKRISGPYALVEISTRRDIAREIRSLTQETPNG